MTFDVIRVFQNMYKLEIHFSVDIVKIIDKL